MLPRDPAVELRAGLAVAGLALVLILFLLGDYAMTKLKTLGAFLGIAAAATLAGCTAMGFSPATQDAIGKAVAEKIPYCSGDIQVEGSLGGLAGTGTGLKQAGQLHCPGKPYGPDPAPAAPASASPAAAAPSPQG